MGGEPQSQRGGAARTGQNSAVSPCFQRLKRTHSANLQKFAENPIKFKHLRTIFKITRKKCLLSQIFMLKNMRMQFFNITFYFALIPFSTQKVIRENAPTARILLPVKFPSSFSIQRAAKPRLSATIPLPFADSDFNPVNHPGISSVLPVHPPQPGSFKPLFCPFQGSHTSHRHTVGGEADHNPY